MENDTQNTAQDTIDFIQDTNTALSMTSEEKDTAEDRLKENRKDFDEDRAIRQTLKEIRIIRENKAAEQRSRATYQETKTLEAAIDTIREYRDQRRKITDQIASIRNDERYSDSHKAELIAEQQKKLKERTAADREATLALVDEITKARQAYDQAFFTSPERMDAANRAIQALKTAGQYLSPKDFTNLIAPFYGDQAALRYISAAVTDTPVLFKGVIGKMTVDPEAIFYQSREQIEHLFAGNYSAYDVERLLLSQAEQVGISTTITDYSEPIFSENRNRALTAEIDGDELEQLVRKSMRGY